MPEIDFMAMLAHERKRAKEQRQAEARDRQLAQRQAKAAEAQAEAKATAAQDGVAPPVHAKPTAPALDLVTLAGPGRLRSGTPLSRAADSAAPVRTHACRIKTPPRSRRAAPCERTAANVFYTFVRQHVPDLATSLPAPRLAPAPPASLRGAACAGASCAAAIPFACPCRPFKLVAHADAAHAGAAHADVAHAGVAHAGVYPCWRLPTLARPMPTRPHRYMDLFLSPEEQQGACTSGETKSECGGIS